VAISFDLKFLLAQWREKQIMLMVAWGVFLYAVVGLGCVFMGGNYLDYGFLNPVLPGEQDMARSHGILLVEIGVGITVMFSMIGIHINLASNGHFDRGL
jgi:multicomponent Na+:H+ antiporter subunit B